jgi:hypothetical protein
MKLFIWYINSGTIISVANNLQEAINTYYISLKGLPGENIDNRNPDEIHDLPFATSVYS